MNTAQKKSFKTNTLHYFPLLSQLTFYHTFRSWSHFLKKSQTWDKKKINSYQLKRIQCLLEHCLQHVPYYKHLFESNAIKLKTITSLADLGNIPLLTKDIIRNQQHTLKAINYPRNAFYQYHTGGTTGKPLYFYVEKARWLGIHFAFNRHYMKNGGYHSYDKVISFCGIKTPVKYHPLYRTVELSSFHSTSSDFDQYNRIIHRFNPQFITAFPSALLLFTRDILNRKKNLYTNINAIYCHGEVLDETQRIFLEETYDCRVFDQYGHREQCVYATTCPESNLYHVYPQYGIVEILDTQGQPIQSEDKTGEIIATSLINNVFPFIRYKTDDFAETTSQTCPCMNHTLFIKRILGRTQEFLISRNHEKIPLTGLYHIFSQYNIPIKECQIIQEKEGELTILIVPEKSFVETDKKRLHNIYQEILGKQFTFNIELVQSIKRTEQGKYQYLIQKISLRD